jgi:translation initiation factor IF-3
LRDDRRTPHQRVNREIRSPRLRLIDENGMQLGIKTLDESLTIARERMLDLVEIAPQSDPPVARIMDYGKFRYEQSKKEKLAKKKQQSIKLKEIKMTPNIYQHDYEIKVRKVREFLEEGNKVKVTIKFRGREILHKEFGIDLINRLVADVSVLGAQEGGSKMMGKNLSIVVSPKNTTHPKGPSHAEAQNV